MPKNNFLDQLHEMMKSRPENYKLINIRFKLKPGLYVVSTVKQTAHNNYVENVTIAIKLYTVDFCLCWGFILLLDRISPLSG